MSIFTGYPQEGYDPRPTQGLGSSWHSPQSIYNVGHRAIAQLFQVDCYVTEKVDGSFFAFGAHRDDEGNLELRIRSKGAMMYPNAPEKMFSKAADTAKKLFNAGLLREGWTYRGEYLQKPHHNALNYDRVPKDHIILFDICTGEEDYAPYELVAAEASRLGLEVVPRLLDKTPTDVEMRDILDSTYSILGGQRIEGIVVKQKTPVLYGPDKKILMAKFVSERFRETHKQTWGESNPGPSDVNERIAKEVCTTARWEKAIIHLKERGEFEQSPRDIPKLLNEVKMDIVKEQKEEIMRLLWRAHHQAIIRHATKGLPEWFKNEIIRMAAEQGTFDAAASSNITGEFVNEDDQRVEGSTEERPAEAASGA